MLDKLLGNIIEVSVLQSLKANSLILLTGHPSISAGMATFSIIVLVCPVTE